MLDSFLSQKNILHNLVSYNSSIFLSHPNPRVTFFFKHSIAIFSLFHAMQTPHNCSFFETLNQLCREIKFSEMQMKLKEKKEKYFNYMFIFSVTIIIVFLTM